MANKTATLKNQAGDNIYPNIVGDNRNTAIKDSTTIKHTLADNKISLDLDETIKGKIDAALQKPTGLTKTKLVGVGVNGQENIEIGDNLTLANGKLSATSGVNGLTSDAEGNLTASKDVKVDGKLKLKSLVSASNPDGDITKELGGGITLYRHNIRIKTGDGSQACFDVYRKTDEKFTITTFNKYIEGKKFACSGMVKRNDQWLPIDLVWGFMGSIYCEWLDLTTGNKDSKGLSITQIDEKVLPVD